MQMERVISAGQLVPLVFMQNAVAASQTDVQLSIAEVAAGAANAADGYTMPFPFDIVAVSYFLTAAGSAGVFTIGPTIDGTEKTDLTQTVGTTTEGSASVPREKVRGLRLNQVGVEITTDGSWDGVTADLVVVVWVLLYMEGI